MKLIFDAVAAPACCCGVATTRLFLLACMERQGHREFSSNLLQTKGLIKGTERRWMLRCCCVGEATAAAAGGADGKGKRQLLFLPPVCDDLHNRDTGSGKTCLPTARKSWCVTSEIREI